MIEAWSYSESIGFQIVSVHLRPSRSPYIACGTANHIESFVLESTRAVLQANLVQGAESFDHDVLSLTKQIINTTTHLSL